MGSKAGQVQETGAQRAQAEHAMELLQDYKQRWLPVQQKLASTIKQSGEKDSAARRLSAGKSSTDVAMNFDKAEGALEKGLSNSGAAPGSSRSNLAITGLGTDAAASTSVGHMMSEQSIDDAYTQGLGALTAIGRGERAQVSANMGVEAASSAQQAGADAASALATRQGEAALVGQVGGFGLQRAMKGVGTPPPATAGGSGTGIGAANGSSFNINY